MTRIKENKTRKRLRISLCILYLFQIVLCAWPYLQYIETDGNKSVLHTYTILDFFSTWGGDYSKVETLQAFSASVFLLVFLVIPIAGFFFCALDKERNLKNVVSLLCCLLGVLSILFIVTPKFISTGSMLALLLYILICFLTTISIFARFAKEPENKGTAD